MERGVVLYNRVCMCVQCLHCGEVNVEEQLITNKITNCCI